MENGEPSILINIVAFVAVGVVALAFANGRWGSPLVASFNRGMRWLVFAFGLALVARELGWTERPVLVLAAISFLLWFLAETIFNWLAINALSQSSIPL